MDLDKLLTYDQQLRLLELLAQVCEIQHGEVTIRVVNGKAKFISVTYETKLEEKLSREGW